MAKAILASTVLLAAIAAGVAAVRGRISSRSSAAEVRVVPGPAVDARPGQASLQTAVLAGGCFWGVQGVVQHKGFLLTY